MKNRLILIVLCLCFLISTVACNMVGDVAETASPSGVSQEMTSSQPEVESKPESVESETEPEVQIEIPYPLEMYFSSGAGAWFTKLTINADGSFVGEYHDSNMGEIGQEYPNGTVYECVFSGKFSGLRPVNDYTFALTLETLEWDGEADQTRIEDGILYKISYPYGLMNADDSAPAKDFLLYTPNTPTLKLLEEEDFLSWWPDRYGADMDGNLNVYALHNVETGEGFFSSLDN